jgi:P-type Mg2+ transporter
MPIVPTAVLPKRIPHGPLKPSTTIQVSPQLLEAAATESEEVLRKMNTSKDGLAGAEAERRLQEYGPNVAARETRHSYLRLLGNALINPVGPKYSAQLQMPSRTRLAAPLPSARSCA